MLWDVCKTCKGTGRTEGNAYYRSEFCIICKGEGRIKVDGQEFDEKGEPVKDMVNSPKHYTFGTIEVITVIEDWQLGFHEGNCIKYIARAKHKGNELEDLKKAQWYLNRKITDIELEIAAKDDK